jgi:dihydroxyacetone kinase-like protein
MGEACKLARMVEESSYSTGRRGVAGTLIVEKIIGAAAEEGRDLEP